LVPIIAAIITSIVTPTLLGVVHIPIPDPNSNNGRVSQHLEDNLDIKALRSSDLPQNSRTITTLGQDYI
jgi:hypothetical protein